ncbi:NADPH-dependent FMN reductase [Peterkaempfera griseoplana]|uniref:NADPH-dependent FMN reductase n=1 Tax=Peterkaempfera griseoplana TaxID=66896 RepID=UPI0006E1ABBB|nr:NADPH-dependent FMN reductase [Peterkaempfera griseoplana]
MKILAVSGSLRPGSTVTTLMHAALGLLPPGSEAVVHASPAGLPYFDPGVDPDDAPAAVQAWRAPVAAADAVLIASPEYAHGMPGVLKNALEWLVGSGELAGKPVALLTASPYPTGGDRARAWLTETLTVMSAALVPEASLGVGMVRSRLGPDGALTDPATAEALRGAWAAVERAVQATADR